MNCRFFAFAVSLGSMFTTGFRRILMFTALPRMFPLPSPALHLLISVLTLAFNMTLAHSFTFDPTTTLILK